MQLDLVGEGCAVVVVGRGRQGQQAGSGWKLHLLCVAVGL
jgi:hypothetical protein